MIDPKARVELSEALASLVEGRMTNDEFDDLYAERWAESTDPGVARIAAFGEGLYTDAMTYRLEGVHAVDAGTRKIADRCVLFLKSGLEYGWPNPPATGLQCAAGGLTIFLLLPFGIVLLIAAAILRTAGLLMAGLAVLGLCWFLWQWSRNDDTPQWREYWAHGDREAWPFVRLADCEQNGKRVQSPSRPL
jgi:hypothetical protein